MISENKYRAGGDDKVIRVCKAEEACQPLFTKPTKSSVQIVLISQVRNVNTNWTFMNICIACKTTRSAETNVAQKHQKEFIRVTSKI